MSKNSPRLLLQLKHYSKELKGFAMFPQGKKADLWSKKIAELERKSHDKYYYLTPNTSIEILPNELPAYAAAPKSNAASCEDLSWGLLQLLHQRYLVAGSKACGCSS